MNTYSLFRNIKRWLAIHGQDLLDLILPIADDTKTNPLERYDNFAEELNKHFNLLAYYQSQPKPDLPVILVSFKDLTGNSCFPKMRIYFDVYFETIAPQDCKDNRTIVCNTPEDILNYNQLVNEALYCMMMNVDEDMRLEVFEGMPWDYPINFNVTENEDGIVEGLAEDEILHFQTWFDLSDNISIC